MYFMGHILAEYLWRCTHNALKQSRKIIDIWNTALLDNGFNGQIRV